MRFLNQGDSDEHQQVDIGRRDDAGIDWHDPRPGALAKERDYDEQITYGELPKAVQRRWTRNGGNHEVTSFQHVMRDGKEFYRAVIDTKGNDKVIRVQPAATCGPSRRPATLAG